jgi:hypothetical protein
MSSFRTNEGLDPIRSRIVKLAGNRGLTLKELSLMVGRNHAYLQQFVRRGSPRNLPEAIRLELSRILAVPESDLNAAKAHDQWNFAIDLHELSDAGLMSFAMRLAVVRLKSSNPTPALFAGSLGIELARYNDLENGNDDPTLQELDLISRNTMVSLDWLIRGPVEFDSDETGTAGGAVDGLDHRN